MLLRKSSRPTEREGVGPQTALQVACETLPPCAHTVINSNDSASQHVASGEHSTAKRRPMRA